MNARFIHDRRKPWHSAFGCRLKEQLEIIKEMEVRVLYMRILFSCLRSIGDTYDNPTPTDFKSRFRQMLLGSELPLPQGACVEDDGVRPKPYLTSQMFTELSVNATENKDEENEEFQEEDVVTPLTRSWEKNSALRYVAGYLVHASEITIGL
ncbi:hypothetical protein PR048_020504 [Dryococelus australis]|uniref:Uncharacterized protein n=1 Tax=Dryococelus australis TaxID=614101 RepID=A0ABQ9H6H2_9NEOP|nr:hypothetical protein PR048_020504 [Dryococelus australis]